MTAWCSPGWAARRWRRRSSARPPASRSCARHDRPGAGPRCAVDRPRQDGRRRSAPSPAAPSRPTAIAGPREPRSRPPGSTRADRIVVVTDPGSPLEQTAKNEGSRAVFLADPDVGGRYSALTAFGLVPAALAGVDVAALLDEAAALEPSLGEPSDNPALALGAVMGGAALAGRDKLVLADAGSGIVGFGDWAEQLVAESTGKLGKGILPVVVESVDAPGTTPASDVHLVVIGADAPADGTAVSGPLGGQFLAWEYATAVAGRALQINPFDQPNVQESKDNTKAILEGTAPTTARRRSPRARSRSTARRARPTSTWPRLPSCWRASPSAAISPSWPTWTGTPTPARTTCGRCSRPGSPTR